MGGNLLKLTGPQFEVFTTYRTNSISIPGVQSVSLDVENEHDIRRVVNNIHPDIIIHCAARPDMDWCEKNERMAIRINAEATRVMAEICSGLGCRLIYASTDMVFDGEKGNYSECDDPNPINVYGRTKLEGENSVRALCTNYCIVRIALVYGTPVTGSNSFSQRIMERIVQGKVMPLFTDQYRTPILVIDLAKAILELAEHPFTGTLHLGGIERVDRYTFGLYMAKLKGLPVDLLMPVLMAEVPTTAPRPRDASLNTDRAKSLLKTELRGYRQGLEQA